VNYSLKNKYFMNRYEKLVFCLIAIVCFSGCGKSVEEQMRDDMKKNGEVLREEIKKTSETTRREMEKNAETIRNSLRK